MRLPRYTAAIAAMVSVGAAQAHVKVGDHEPKFSITTYDKQKVSADQLLGNVVIINRWAAWCGPCKTEIPALDAYYREHAKDGLRIYAIGLGLASLLTVASFVTAGTGLVWTPGIPAALLALAVGQIGVHLVFFLHITSGPENTNNTLALAFGFGIVLLVVGGSMWIIAHLDHNMMPMSRVMQMQK